MNIEVAPSALPAHLMPSIDDSELPKPPFQYEVLWTKSYDELFEGRAAETGDIGSLLRETNLGGRVVLSGRGGSGKTVALKRLCLQARTDPDVLPIYVDLSKWTEAHSIEWQGLEPRDPFRINFLLESFARVTQKAEAIEFTLHPEAQKLLVVDGLNEVRIAVGQEILEEVSALVTYGAGWSVLVADRLIRRKFPATSRWRLATLAPLSKSEQARILSDAGKPAVASALLDLPFFMNLFLGENGVAPSKAAMIRMWFEQHSDLGEADLLGVAESAFEIYAKSGSRTFSLSAFQESAGEEVTSRLLSSGALVTSELGTTFTHHLLHDYLASLWVVSRFPMAQGRLRESFDDVTFRATSFDAIGLLLQQAVDTVNADNIVRAIYDWNLYGAAYAVSEAQAEGSSFVSRDMELVLLAMLTEKTWDVFRASAQKASDALRQFPRAIGGKFLALTHLSDLIALMRSIEGRTAWYDDWLELFCSEGSGAVPAALAALRDEESVRGWTAANVLRRLPLAKKDLDIVRTLLREGDSPTVRWRSAHVLGPFPSEVNRRVLGDALEVDRDRWVKYGCIRSLVEIAARRESLRKGAFAVLGRMVHALRNDQRLTEELRATLFVAPTAIPNWSGAAWKAALEPLVATYHDAEPSQSWRNRWQETAYELRGAYE